MKSSVTLDFHFPELIYSASLARGPLWGVLRLGAARGHMFIQILYPSNTEQVYNLYSILEGNFDYWNCRNGIYKSVPYIFRPSVMTARPLDPILIQ